MFRSSMEMMTAQLPDGWSGKQVDEARALVWRLTDDLAMKLTTIRAAKIKATKH